MTPGVRVLSFVGALCGHGPACGVRATARAQRSACTVASAARRDFASARVSLAGCGCLQARRGFRTAWQPRTACSEHARGVVTAFDKIPTKLPAWWDDEDDDDDEADGDSREAVLRYETTGNDYSRAPTGSIAPDGASGSAVVDTVTAGGGGGGAAGGTGKGGGGRSGGDGSESDGGSEGGWLMAPIRLYVAALSRRPLVTKAVTASVLGMVGDAVAQMLARGQGEGGGHDSRRTVAIGVMGIVFTGPLLHAWYGWLARRVVGKGSLIKKVLLDQLVFASAFNAVFSILLPTLEGHPVRENVDACKSKFWPVMKANWMLFPAAQLVNFAVMPVNLQPVFTNMVGLVWNVVLTYILHDECETVEKPAVAKASTG